MSSHVDCIACMVSRADRLANEFITDKRKKKIFMDRVLKEIAECSYEVTAPYIAACIHRVLKEEVGMEVAYEKEKKFFNDFMMGIQDDIDQIIEKSDNVLATAIKYAMAGNVIDFAAFDNVEQEMVEQTLIKISNEQEIDEKLLKQFEDEISKANNIVYLGDNTGEIVFDRLLIKYLRKLYPQVNITFVTRGMPVFNDITEEDAYYVGIDEYATVTNNGTAIAGTDLDNISKECLELIDNADFIISKGQGNFETLSGCGRNIYYIFLCKCDMFATRLKCDKLSGLFVHEYDIKEVLV